MHVLALEPYFGGSHKAFLDGWQATSRHQWTVLGLAAYKWKWRMRHAALTFAEQVRQQLATDKPARDSACWDVIFCSDMLDLAAFRGLAPAPIRDLPCVAYFHENQFTYPVRHESERDYHFGYTNMTTALAADAVWFNSTYNRDSFLGALPQFLGRMPDYQPVEAAAQILAKSAIWPQGVQEFAPRGERPPGPLHILWAARWEHDKNPELFCDALRQLARASADFQISVIGEQFREIPPVFEQVRSEFADKIQRWGYQPSREEYEAALREADVIVSTAEHEFFGISVVEAIATGAVPLVPRRLAYPEVLSAIDAADEELFFYDGTADGLAMQLKLLTERAAANDVWQGDADRGRRAVERFGWPKLAPRLDDALEQVAAE